MCIYLYKCVRINGLPLENLFSHLAEHKLVQSIINMFLLKSVLFLTISVIQCMYMSIEILGPVKIQFN